MLVIAALIASIVGQVATVSCLAATCILTLIRRHPVALLPAALALLWIWATVDIVDLFDGPMRMDADANLLGTGRPPPAYLARGIGPVWWIPTATAATFALFTRWPAHAPLRTLAIAGLASLAVTYLGIAALDAMY